MATLRKVASRTLMGFAILAGVLALVLVGAFLLLRSEWAERRIEGLAAERLGREVDLEGLRVLAAWPPQVELEALRIANPDWAKNPWLLDARGVRATLEPGPLLEGRVAGTAAVDDGGAWLEKQGDRTSWALDALQRDAKQEEQASAGGGSRREPMAIRSVSVGRFGVSYLDSEEDTNVGLLASGDLGRDGRPFEAKAEGRVRGQTLTASARAPAVPLSGERPVDLSFELELARTRTAGKVSLRAAADALQSIRGNVEATGPSIAAWKRITQTDLPSSAPYDVRASFRHEGGVWSVEDLKVKLGKSDVQGSASLDTTGERPFLRASLASERFDVKETGVEREVKEELQKKYLIPRDPWPTDELGELDAEIVLEVKEVRNAQPVPFDALAVRAVMKDKRLSVERLRIAFANGTVQGQLALDAASTPETGSAYIEVRNLDLSRVVPSLKKSEEATLGRLNGRVELAGRGKTPAALLGNADGRILFVAERGTASGLLVELLGLDAAEAATLLGKPKKPLPLRCAVVDLKVKDGTAHASPFVIDATDTVLSIEGAIDLGKERLNLTARAEPRDTSLFTLRTPIDIVGTFLDPEVEPHAGPLIGRAAAAVGLAVINPVLALLPFMDPGGDPEPGCQPQQPRKQK